MMTLFDTSRDPAEAMADAAKAFRVPVGFASPLWAVFAATASAGVAFWWLNRWREFTHLEAVLPLPAIEPQIAAPVVPAAPEAAVAKLVTAERAPVEAPAPKIETPKAVVAEPEPVAARIEAAAVVEAPAPVTPAPVAEAPKVEAPKVELVKAEPAKVETPKAEPVKAEPVKAEPTKLEASKPAAKLEVKPAETIATASKAPEAAAKPKTAPEKPKAAAAPRAPRTTAPRRD